MQMIPIRLFFEKRGRAKYTAHLDTMRTMSRAFKRSGLPFWYTQGFNPHLYSTFALPIALGYESTCESVDLRLTQPVEPEEILLRLNACMPEGLRVLRAAPPVKEPVEIAWAQYEIMAFYPQETLAEQERALLAFLEQPEILTEKKGKKGIRTVDIKPSIALLSCGRGENNLVFTMRLAAGNTGSINPTLFLKAFSLASGKEPEFTHILRTGILCENKEDFL